MPNLSSKGSNTAKKTSAVSKISLAQHPLPMQTTTQQLQLSILCAPHFACPPA
jgi:hypothetical protein